MNHPSLLTLISIYFLSSLSLFSQELVPTPDSCLVKISLTDNQDKPYTDLIVVFKKIGTDDLFLRKIDNNGKLKTLLAKNSDYDVSILNGAEMASNFQIITPPDKGLISLEYDWKFDYFPEDKDGEVFITDHFSNDGTLSATDSMILINVSLKNAMNQAITFSTILFKNPVTKEVFVGQTDKNGKFQILLPKGIDFQIRLIHNGNRYPYNNLPTPAEEGLFEVTLDITYSYKEYKTYTEEIISRTQKITNALTEERLPERLILENIYFDFDKATLRPISEIELNKLSEWFRKKPLLEIEIEGHTDNFGTPEYNLILSDNRAKSVMNYLIETGVSPKKLRSVGYGESKPIATNETDEGRQKNRRTEVKVLKQ